MLADGVLTSCIGLGGRGFWTGDDSDSGVAGRCGEFDGQRGEVVGIGWRGVAGVCR